ncbi:GDP-mannose--glycolipid 4-beta-D-mannosyltransferase [Zhihengliuella somnathii]
MSDPEIRVLITVPVDGTGGNPYIDLVCEGIQAAGVRPLRFTWRRALTGRYDAVHFHWPEHLFVSGSRAKTLPKIVLGFAFILRLVLLRVPVVMTIHNLESHESVPRYVRFFMRVTAQMSELFVYLNESEENNRHRGIVVLHQAYPYESGPLTTGSSTKKSEILYFGSLRPYKGLEDVISAFRDARTNNLLPEGARLVIAGQAAVPAYATTISDLCRGDDSLDFQDRFLPARELERKIVESTAVVLPYKQMYNSGAAILALGLGTRILVPASGATVALKDEFPSAVSVYEGELNGQDIAGLAAGAAVAEHELEDFRRRRSIANVGELHQMVYRSLTSQSRWGSRKARRKRALKELRSMSAFKEHSPRNYEDKEY